MITRDEVLMGRDKEFPLNSELEKNLEILLKALNKFRAIYGKPMVVSSGYRPGKHNKSAGGALKSNHVICLACDFQDSDGKLDDFCLKNQSILESCGLWLEHPMATPGWVHLQAVAPRSGRRVFIP
jgi:hypothetical protein